MKSLSMSWALGVLVAVCLTPGLRNRIRTADPSSPSHRATLAQDEPPVAMPGSADAPAGADDDGGYQAGPAEGDAQSPDEAGATDDQPSDDTDSAQPPRGEAQQPSVDDNGDDAAARQQPDEPSEDNADQNSEPDEAPMSPSTGAGEN